MGRTIRKMHDVTPGAGRIPPAPGRPGGTQLRGASAPVNPEGGPTRSEPPVKHKARQMSEVIPQVKRDGPPDTDHRVRRL